jgi:hypothetical protein
VIHNPPFDSKLKEVADANEKPEGEGDGSSNELDLRKASGLFVTQLRSLFTLPTLKVYVHSAHAFQFIFLHLGTFSAFLIHYPIMEYLHKLTFSHHNMESHIGRSTIS